MSVDLANFDLREGDLLAGKFRVERLLGSGGMGVVVEATHITLKDRVALKFLRSPKFADQTTITRFLREAQAAARIKSPHVARVIDVGTLDDGSPYMVMEFLEGMDLGTLLDREGVLPVEQAVTYALQTCEALAAAHASGVIHRDIKPSNLFLTRGPDQTPLVKVLDFGISKIFDGTSSGSITETQRAVGSPSYMAPEQMRSAKRVDGRADIWSMGVVLYELLAGRAPFVADTIPELYALILDKVSRPTPLRTLRAELPEGLEVIAERCLEKNADQRYVDIAELAAALAPFGGEFGPVSAARSRRILESAGLAGNVAGRSDPPDRPASARATGSSGRATGTSGRRTSDVSPPTIREGKPPSSPGSRPDRDAARVSPGPAVRTATSFAETQAPPRRPQKMLFVSAGAGAIVLVVAGVLSVRSRSDPPSTTELGAPAVLVAPTRDPAQPSAAPPPIMAAPADPLAIAPSSSAPVASSSAGSPFASARPSAPGISGATRSRPVPANARPPSDDVLLHRK